jgi:hypothetical protein
MPPRWRRLMWASPLEPVPQRRRLYVAQMSVAWASTILSMGLDNKRVKLDGSG